MVETKDEIMADKLISLVNTQRYVRYRDIWDLRWLKQNGAIINIRWIKQKIRDYQINNYLEKLLVMHQKLPAIIKSQSFKDEMGRFIPTDVQERTLKKDKFLDFLISETQSLLKQVELEIEGKSTEDDFLI